jgi:hypothetical protein
VVLSPFQWKYGVFAGFVPNWLPVKPKLAEVIVNSAPWVSVVPLAATVVDENVAETDPDVNVIVPLTVCE